MNVLEKIEKVNILRPQNNDTIFFKVNDSIKESDKAMMYEQIKQDLDDAYPDLKLNIIIHNCIEDIDIIRDKKD